FVYLSIRFQARRLRLRLSHSQIELRDALSCLKPSAQSKQNGFQGPALGGGSFHAPWRGI
ncbi:MAG: hypothetical protein ORO03_06580, partial [Alphaproteobacteria bacterium]|nr:hypothetical protein [Alphaproteobacteria bacterium]